MDCPHHFRACSADDARENGTAAQGARLNEIESRIPVMRDELLAQADATAEDDKAVAELSDR